MEYAEGQLWFYNARKGEEHSQVLINKIESDPKLGKCIHISVLDLMVKNKRILGGFSTDLPHIPVSEEALNKSLTSFCGMREPNPEYVEGYKIWRDSVDKGEAGIFTIDVAEIVAFVEQTINKE